MTSRACMRTGRNHRHQSQARRAEALFQPHATATTRHGRCTFSPAASRARRCRPSCCGNSRSNTPASTTGCSTSSYQAVGDLAETIAHMLPPPQHSSDVGLAEWMTERIAAVARRAAGNHSRRIVCVVGPDRLARTFSADEVDRRRLSRRRIEAAGHACAGRSRRAGRQAASRSG